MKSNVKLSVMVPSDSAIEHYLWQHPMFTTISDSTESNPTVLFSYEGKIPPLAKISELLAMFEPEQYNISKSETGFFFVVWPSE